MEKYFTNKLEKNLCRKEKNRKLHVKKTHAEKDLNTPTIYKTRNTGTERGMRGTRKMLRNLLEGSGKCHQFNIWANVIKDSRQCKPHAFS